MSDDDDGVIEFVSVATGDVVGTLDPVTLQPSNGMVASVVRAKRDMGWSDEQIVAWAEGWTNGYYSSRRRRSQ